MHTQKNDQIMFAFYRWDAKIKSCKEQDLFVFADNRSRLSGSF